MADTRARDGGATLLEVLIVLALIATTAGVVTLALPKSSTERSVVQEAELLTARLNLAAERSLIEGRSFKMEWTSDGYGFSVLLDGAWQSSRAATLPAEHALTASFSLAEASDARAGEVVITPDLLPPTDGLIALSLSADMTQSSVLFDGLRARLDRDQ